VGRPRLGPPITFRLPLELHDLVATRADAHGMTVNDYVRSRYVAALERRQHLDSVAPIPEIADGRQVEPQWKTPKPPAKGPRK
jgi:hypothetical protein